MGGTIRPLWVDLSIIYGKTYEGTKMKMKTIGSLYEGAYNAGELIMLFY